MKGSVIMRKTTFKALSLIEAWLKSYKRRQWIRGILEDFDDAYCQENSPISAFDASEIDRIHRKISNWYSKAQSKEENLCHEVYNVSKKFRRNKAVIRRYMEVSLWVASQELGMPLEELPGYKKFMTDLKAGKY